MSQPPMDNGEWMMRAQREAAQQQQLNQYNPYLTPRPWTPGEPWARINRYNAYVPGGGLGPPTPGERPEPEDTTGLKMLDEFLQRRKDHGTEDQRQRPEAAGTGKHLARRTSRRRWRGNAGWRRR